MQSSDWLVYFEGNVRRDVAPAASLSAEVSTSLRAALVRSLGRFQLGESAGGRIHADVSAHPDPVLDARTRRAIQLYIEEEWRHARELAAVIHALGGRLQRQHWTNAAFTGCRRLLGLRTKMMTLAIAEAIGIAYYRLLASGAGSPALASMLDRIAREESRHLDFQKAFFERALALTRPILRAPYRALLLGLLFAILTAALCVLLLDHGRLLRRAGATRRGAVQAVWHELASRGLLLQLRPPAPALASVPGRPSAETVVRARA